MKANILKDILSIILLFSVIFTGQGAFFNDSRCASCEIESTGCSCCSSSNADDSNSGKTCCFDKKTDFDWTPASSLQFTTGNNIPLEATASEVFNLHSNIPVNSIVFNDTSPPIYSPREYLAFIQVFLI